MFWCRAGFLKSEEETAWHQEQQKQEQKQQNQQDGDEGAKESTSQTDEEEQQQQQQDEKQFEEDPRQQTALDWLFGDHADAAGGLTLESDDLSDMEPDAPGTTSGRGATSSSSARGSSSRTAAPTSLDFRGLGHELNASELHELIEWYSWNQGNTQLLLAVLAAGLMPNLVHVEYTEKAMEKIKKLVSKKEAEKLRESMSKVNRHQGLAVSSPADGAVGPHIASMAGRQVALDR